MENRENRKIRLRVLTPVRTVYDKQVNMIIARTVAGDIGILHGHDSRTALLDDALLKIYVNDDNNGDIKDIKDIKDIRDDAADAGKKNEELLMVLGGVLTVHDNEAVILSEIAEHPDKLQEFIDKLNEERSAHKIKEQNTDVAMRRMEFAIRRALVHMDVSAYSILKGHGEQENHKSEK